MLIKTLGDCLGLTGTMEEWPRQPLTLLETSGYRATPSWLARKFRYGRRGVFLLLIFSFGYALIGTALYLQAMAATPLFGG